MNKKDSLVAAVGLLLSVGCCFILGQCKGETIDETSRSSDAHLTADKAVESETLDTVQIVEIPDRPEGRLVPVNGIRMYCEVMGEGEPLLLINGGAATIESWFCQIPEFRKRYQVIAVDSRGHGRTQDGEGPINFKLMASDYAGLLDHLGLKNVGIVGWSDGGVIGFELALQRPDLVRKIVALGTHSRPSGMTEEFRQEIENSTPENFPAILSDSYKALSPDGPEHWPVVFEKLKTMWLTLPNFTEEELRGIRVPVLLMVGESDIIRREESDRLATLIPAAKLTVLKGASHYSPVEIPDVVNKTILAFLETP